MQLTEVSTTWLKIKNCHNEHGNKICWSDLGSEYIILVDHPPFRYRVTIAKTDPRSADQADFEDNYKD